jgi:hypothetical protein
MGGERSATSTDERPARYHCRRVDRSVLGSRRKLLSSRGRDADGRGALFHLCSSAAQLPSRGNRGTVDVTFSLSTWLWFNAYASWSRPRRRLAFVVRVESRALRKSDSDSFQPAACLFRCSLSCCGWARRCGHIAKCRRQLLDESLKGFAGGNPAGTGRAPSNRTRVPSGRFTPTVIQRMRVERCGFAPCRPGGNKALASSWSPITSPSPRRPLPRQGLRSVP